MSFLKRIFGQDKPFWEKSFNPSELKAFYDAVYEHFKSQGRSFEIKSGYVMFQCGSEKIDLRNIAQNCRQAEESQWQKIIESSFRQLENIKGNAFSVSEKLFYEIVELLAVRLWPDGTLQNVGAENLIYRTDLEGTISTIVLDLPDSILAVTPQMAIAWGKSKDELFSIGFDNVFTHHQPVIGDTVLGDDFKIITLSGNNDFFAATHIFSINKYPGCTGKYGSLVGIPLRDIVACYPVNDGQLAKVIAVFLLTVRNIYIKGPGSVSPHLYWYHENQFDTIHYIEKENKFVLPDKLLEIMESTSENKN
jgi:hypothetical protein